jgi:uncharacterized membrane protein YoaK (UPF0700 family)
MVQTIRPPAGDRHGPLAPLLLTLTFVTGLVDAVSYLKLGHVFVANMTGNVVFLGFALAGAKGLSTSFSLLALGSFLLGALAGGRLAAARSGDRARLLRASCAIQALLIAAAFLLELTASSQGRLLSDVLILLLASAMGVQNASARRLAVPDLTTTVLTLTLTGIAADSALAGGSGSKPGRRILAVVVMALGALSGGLLVLHVSVTAPLGLALALVGLSGLSVHLLSRTAAAGWKEP